MIRNATVSIGVPKDSTPDPANVFKANKPVAFRDDWENLARRDEALGQQDELL